MSMISDKVHILLCGYYFHGNTGDDLLMESITKALSKYGDVEVVNGFDRGKIDWCDLLVIGGGSHIRATSIGPHELAQYAKKTGKKIIYYAQTIEEGHPLFKEHLALADLITVRESESRRVVERNGFRAVLSSDPIFKRRKHTIGFSFRRWVTEPADIEEKLASMLDNLSKDFDVISIPYTPNDTDTESDTAFHEHIIQRMSYKPKHCNYDEAIKSIDLLIGMRLHALISAVNVGKKVLAIDYDAKVGRIFADLAMGDLVVSYNDVEKIPDLVRNKIYKVAALAQREKVNEALIAKMCADIKRAPVPHISAVMYTHNLAYCIKKAIDSIVDQTIKDWELIVIDDGSIDNTGDIVVQYHDARIKYFNFGHNGVGFSRNVANLLCRGEMICVTDPDTISMPDRFETLLGEMKRVNADVLYSSLCYLKSDGESTILESQPFVDETLRISDYIYHSTVAYKPEVAIKCPYNEDHEISADYHMYLKASDSGYNFHYVEKPLIIHLSQDEQYFTSKKSLDAAKCINEHPIVSVIIPTCNRPEFLKEALQSVMSQTYRNFEVIVINDGGKDVSDVIKSLDGNEKIVYLTHENKKGPSAARNTGLKAARGKYIAYLDDDDIYYPNHIQTLISCLERNNYDVAYTDSIQARQSLINDRYVTTDKSLMYNHDFNRERFLVGNYIHIISIVHKRNLLEDVGYFDEELETQEDWDLCIRLSRKCDFFHIKSATAEFRMRDDKTNSTYIKRADFLRTLKLIYQRYSHLVTNTAILEAQKDVEESLAVEVAIRQLPSEDLVEKIDRYIKKKDQQINNLNNLLRDKDVYIGNLEALVQDRIAHIRNLEALVQDRIAHIGNLEVLVQDRIAHIRNLEALVQDRIAHIRNLETAPEVKDRLVELVEQIQAKDVCIQNIEYELDMIKHSRVWRFAEALRALVYIKILGYFPLLQQSALTISGAGFPVFYQKAKRRMKKHLRQFNKLLGISDGPPSESVPLKNMDAKIYVQLSEFKMKANQETVKMKLRTIIEEIEKKRGL